MTGSIQLWLFWALCGYFLLFVAIAGGIAIWNAKRRRDRPPVKFKLLRGPGESLRRRIAKYDEDCVFRLGAAAALPIVASALAFLLLQLAPKPVTWPQFYLWWAGPVVSFVVVLPLAIRWVVRDLQRYRSDHLGYLGEREVAEQLQPLAASGYRIFHDVPAVGATQPFNLDHVVVGPAGVAVVETKTRRKGRARPGCKDHEVAFDGRQLIWPWGEDRHGIDQALAEADWLQKLILQRLGISTKARAILALPGWWVNANADHPVMVVNSKMTPTAVQRGPRILSDQQIDLIARQLDQLCRDVED